MSNRNLCGQKSNLTKSFGVLRQLNCANCATTGRREKNEGQTWHTSKVGGIRGMGSNWVMECKLEQHETES